MHIDYGYYTPSYMGREGDQLHQLLKWRDEILNYPEITPYLDWRDQRRFLKIEKVINAMLYRQQTSRKTRQKLKVKLRIQRITLIFLLSELFASIVTKILLNTLNMFYYGVVVSLVIAVLSTVILEGIKLWEDGELCSTQQNSQN